MTPVVLCGEFGGMKTLWLELLGWGRMWNRDNPRQAYEGEPWAFDNGAFGAWVNGTQWDESAYLRRLERAVAFGVPLFGVVPDLPAEGLRSLDFSLRWLERLPPWPWYLAVQDGMTTTDVSPHLDKFAGLFLGGSDAFKATAWEWSELAHANGLRFHYARVGNVEKLRLARYANADSVDSTGIAQNDRRDNSFLRFAWEWKYPQEDLFSGVA